MTSYSITQYPRRTQPKPASTVQAKRPASKSASTSQPKNPVAEYRARVLSILTAHATAGRFRQSCCLALETDMAADVAIKFLSTMATDKEISIPHGHKYFDLRAGLLSPELMIENARISAIIRSPQAEGRERFAAYVACGSDIDLATAVTLLASAPKEPEQAVMPSLEQQRNAGASFGCDPVPMSAGGGSGSRSSWSKAVQKFNTEVASGGDKTDSLGGPFDY
ncbi:MAG: hypothetical protein CTY31_12530 [Hyphomicrobium sp.]|nr:MAG: hypothetical protein CTY39_09380 [Hyphomicrobium sp.]PPC98585.1 MAG: hypothetical protein CTY31_12530 [Hyphomicrobium sp.]